MKYIAPVAPARPSAGAGASGADDLDDLRIVELTDGSIDIVRTGSRRWIGVVIALAAAVTGFGFVSHGSEASLLGPARVPADGRSVESAPREGRVAPEATEETVQGADDRPITISGPAEGAMVTSGVTMTGGVVVVDATARRALGLVHASVSIGELVLGSSDIDVQAAGTFRIRITLFPPSFNAPVVLRMQAESTASGAGFDVARGFHLAIPSAVGFWDASPTGLVDARGRVQVLIRGYGPLSARTLDIAVRDARGHDVAKTSVRLAVDWALPDAAGGQILGLGSFNSSLWLPPESEGERSIIASWRDAASGVRLHVETMLTPELS